MNDQPERLRSNEYWGKKSGGFYWDVKPKNASYVSGLTVKIRRGSQNGGTSNSGPAGKRKNRFYQGRVLAKPAPKRK